MLPGPYRRPRQAVLLGSYRYPRQALLPEAVRWGPWKKNLLLGVVRVGVRTEPLHPVDSQPSSCSFHKLGGRFRGRKTAMVSRFIQLS